MAVTRIKNNQITDSTITGSKFVEKTITGGLLSDNLTYASNFTISGNLTVSGTTTTVDTTNTVIADPLILLSRGETGTPSADSGFVIERGTSDNAAFVWQESEDRFIAVLTDDDGETVGSIGIESFADLKVGDLEAATSSIGNIDIGGNSITSTDTNGDINIVPNGTGDVYLGADTVIVGDANANVTVTTNGTGDLTLNTNDGTNSGSIVIEQGENGDITISPNGTGTVNITNLVNSDLTDGRVVLAGTGGVLEDSANLTFDGSLLTVTGSANISANLDVGAEATLASATVSDLTDGRIVLAGTAGAIEDSANLTFDGSLLTVTGSANVSVDLDVGANLDVGSEATLASAIVSDLTDGRIVLAGTAGAIEDSANLTFDGSLLTVTGSANISANLDVGAEATLASATVSDLTDGRIVLAGTAGAIEDSANLTFDGSLLTVTGSANISVNLDVGANLDVGSEATLASAIVSDLTDGRIVLAGTAGAIEDSANLTFDGSLLTVTGSANISANLDVGAEATLASATISDLTDGRVVLAGTVGAVEDSANLTFDGSLLTVTGSANVSVDLDVGGNLDVGSEATLASATVSDLTDGRIVLAGTAGAIEDSANLTFDGSTLTVTGSANVSVDLDVGANLDVGAEATLASATVSDLTDGRIVLAGTAGAIEDSANLTFDGSTLTVTGSANISVNLAVGSEATLASAIVSDLTDGRVVLAGTAGAIEDSANLTFDGNTLTVNGNVASTSLTSGNITVNGDTISSVHDTITIDPATAGPGGTVVIAGNLQVTGTTTTVDSTIVTIADPVIQIGNNSTNDNLDRGIKALYNDGSPKIAFFGLDDSASEFVFILDATDSSSIFSGNLGSAAFGSLRVTDLTDGRILTAGANGAVEDSANLTFDGSLLTVTGSANISANLDVGSEATLASATISDLTDGRIVLAGTAGAIEDSANLTFDGTELTTSSLTVSDLTDGRVVLAGTAGAVEDSANLTFDGSTLTVTGSANVSVDLDVGANLDVGSEATLASATVSDLTDGRIVLAGTAGAIEDSANLTFDGSLLTVTGSANISANLDVGAEATLASATISDLTDGRVVLAGTVGAVEDSANLTFDGSTLTVTGSANVSVDLDVGGNLDVGTEATLASATISDLTDGRVVLAGTAGAVEDSANLTFDGSTLTVTGSANVSVDLDVGANLDVGSEATLASAIVSDLTDGRVVLAGTAGAIEDSANLTFDGSTLTVTGSANISANLNVGTEATLASATISDLTDGRVVLAGTAGAVEDSANLTFDGSTLTVTGAANIDNISIDGNSITSSDALTIDVADTKSIVINEAGLDVDIRIESDDEVNAFFIDGGTGNIGIKTATPNAGADLHVNSTNSIIIPIGTTGQRPTAATGMVRFNTTTGSLEFYDGAEWINAGSDFTIFVADSFTGDGSTVEFTLSKDATSAGVLIALNGVVQNPGTAYSISGTTLTFTEAPAASDNIDVRILTTTAAVIEIADSNTSIGVNNTTETATTTINGNVVMTVTNAAVVPGANVTYDLGTDTLRWKDLYLSGTSIILGELVLKDNGSNVLGIFQSDGTTPATIDSTNVDIATISNGTSNVAVAANANVTVTVAANTVATFNAAGLTVNSITADNITVDGDTISSVHNTIIIDPATAGAGGTVIIEGNLQVTGTTTTIDSTTITVADKNIVIASGAANAAAADGAGITVDGASATITYASTGDKWVFNKNGDFGANTVTAATFNGQATSAQYADLAENYTADAEYEPGTVVSFGGAAEVTVTDTDADRRVAGVVSTNPAHLMNAGLKSAHVVALALQGRVPCRVIGVVEKGDLMVAAGNGFARAEADPKVGSVIGKALESHTGGEGTIEVAVGRF